MQLDNNKSTVFNENKDILPMDIIKSENETEKDEEDMEEDEEYVIEFNFIFKNELNCNSKF